MTDRLLLKLLLASMLVYLLGATTATRAAGHDPHPIPIPFVAQGADLLSA